MLDVADLMRTDAQGRGIVNVLAADKLMQAPRLYAIFLLWLLGDLYEKLPEVGDMEQPKLVFFFDEAHLLFTDAPQALLTKIEQVVRLVRSKGVGVYFVTQNPLDIPDTVLGQLGNRVQHALRAFTPRDQKAVKTAAQTMRPNPGWISRPPSPNWASARPWCPCWTPGAAAAHRARLDRAAGQPHRAGHGCRAPGVAPGQSLVGKYEQAIDRESAYEVLAGRASAPAGQNGGGAAAPGAPAGGQAPAGEEGGFMQGLNEVLFGSTGPRGGKRDGVVQTMAKSTVRTVARELARGILGSLLGSKGRR